MKWSSLMLLSVILMLLSACSDQEGVQNIEFDIVTKESILPDRFEFLSTANEERSNLMYLVRHANNLDTAEDLWRLYNLNDSVPDIDFEEEHLLFIGHYGSSNCEKEFGSIELSDDKKTLSIPFEETAENNATFCTVDPESPVTTVLSLNKEQTQELESVLFSEGGFGTEIVINER